MSCLLKLSAAMILATAVTASTCLGAEGTSDANVHPRGTFANSRLRFERDKQGHVGFIGGSITEMNGYRPMVMEILQRRFPDTEFEFTNAGISSTCSTTGAFRLREDVLSKGPVDLLLIEFAVNDDQDAGHARRECIRGMEGIIRHTRDHNPNADIVVTYFVNPGMLATWQAGEVPLSVTAHDAVVEHYQVPTINLAKEVADRITGKTLTWEDFGGTHPKPLGNAIAATMIDRLMELTWSEPIVPEEEAIPHAMPDPLDPKSYTRGRFIPPTAASELKRMAIETPVWKELKGSSRSRFINEVLLCAEVPGSEMTLDFEGTAIGAYVLAGPDAGVVETSIDDGPYRPTNLFHRFSTGLHYPRTLVFAADLAPGPHVLRLRIADTNHPDSIGHALRALQFVAN